MKIMLQNIMENHPISVISVVINFTQLFISKNIRMNTNMRIGDSTAHNVNTLAKLRRLWGGIPQLNTQMNVHLSARLVTQRLKIKQIWFIMRGSIVVKNHISANIVKSHLDRKNIGQDMRIFMNKIINTLAWFVTENLSKLVISNYIWVSTTPQQYRNTFIDISLQKS